MNRRIELSSQTGLGKKLVGFCGFIRLNGIPTTVAETLDATAALQSVGVEDRERFYRALQVTLVKDPDDFALFADLFDKFWESRSDDDDKDDESIKKVQTKSTEDEHEIQHRALLRHSEIDSPIPKESKDLTYSRDLAEQDPLTFYSPIEILGKKDFSRITTDDISGTRRGVKRLARRLATVEGRRRTPSKEGRPDFRRMLRRSLTTEGEFIKIVRRVREISRAQLVILCDISGSMDKYSERIFKIIYFSYRSVPRTRIFAFSTQTVELTPFLQRKSIYEVARMISAKVKIWNSGTRIGSALGELVSRHSSALGEDSVLVVISDGWDVGDLTDLRKNIQEVRRRTRMILWLNPLADTPRYEPSTLGIKTVLPYVDVFGGLKILIDRGRLDEALKRKKRTRA